MKQQSDEIHCYFVLITSMHESNLCRAQNIWFCVHERKLSAGLICVCTSAQDLSIPQKVIPLFSVLYLSTLLINLQYMSTEATLSTAKLLSTGLHATLIHSVSVL